jgi:hypothetical protein
MNCPKCGAEIETLVVNVQDGSEGCWPCIAGPARCNPVLTPLVESDLNSICANFGTEPQVSG